MIISSLLRFFVSNWKLLLLALLLSIIICLVLYNRQLSSTIDVNNKECEVQKYKLNYELSQAANAALKKSYDDGVLFAKENIKANETVRVVKETEIHENTKYVEQAKQESNLNVIWNRFDSILNKL